MKKPSGEEWQEQMGQWRALYDASRALDFELVRQLLRQYPDVRSPANGMTWLQETARIAMLDAHHAGNLERVQQLLKEHSYLETMVPVREKIFRSWLPFAVQGDSVPLVTFWLDRGQNQELKTALLDARSAAMTSFLLSRGADPNAWYGPWGTPLHRAKEPEQIRLLAAAGADPAKCDRDGLTPLAKMRQSNRTAMVEALVAAGAPMEGQLPAAEKRRRRGLISGVVTVDMREELPELLAYVDRRVREHVAASAKKRKPQPVRRIDFGFEFGQDNWVVLVFDTREDAGPDGEWTAHINNKVMLRRPKWPILHKLADDAKVYFVDLGGKKTDDIVAGGTADPDKIIGETLKHVLVTARERGAYSALVKAERCELGVEGLEGGYGWPIFEDRGKENLV